MNQLPFSLRQLQYAVAVADALSFRRAAERCAVSQPSLSAQLAELEDALGVRLFDRDRRRVVVTPAGAELVARARALLVAAGDLLEAGRRAADPLAGALRLGVIPTVAPYLVPALTPRLRAELPRATVSWLEDRTAALVRRLDDGELDGAVLALEAALGDVEREIIARDPFVLATPVGHPLGRKKACAAPADLDGAEVLLLDDGHCLRDQALAVCGAARARELGFRATSLATLVQMVAGGTGVTLLPALAVPTEARRAALWLRPFAEPGPARTLALVWRRRSSMGPALRRVAALMRAAYPGATPAPPASAPAPAARAGSARGRSRSARSRRSSASRAAASPASARGRRP